MRMKCFGEKPMIYHCKIILLDETELIQEIQHTSKGQDLLDVVFRHLNLLETAYFGLRYIDSTGQTHWLDPTLKVVKQLKGVTPYTLYFGVKFYAADPCKLLEEITRYQFFLQLKQDILQGRLPLSYDLTAELFSYAVQSELGDYDSRRHQTGYVSEFRFVVNQTKELENKVMELHKGLTGQVPATSEISFLDRIKWLDMYGVDLHPVLGEDNVEYFLGLSPSGVVVLRNKAAVGNYFWPRITKVYYKGRYFMLRVRDKNNDESTYGFELPTKQACKHLWKCCVEHHAFFRLTQVREVPGHSGKTPAINTRFSSTRSDKRNDMESRHWARPQPTVVRVPSRRYQKRLGQPDGADAGVTNKEMTKENNVMEPKPIIILPQPVHYPASMHRSISMPSALPRSDSPRSARSAPWEDPKQRGLFSSSAAPSPRSVRSAGSRHSHHRRHASVESNHSSDSHHRKRQHRSRRNSDNESEVSQMSKGSRHSKSSNKSGHRKHRSQSRESCSGSESDIYHRKGHCRRSSGNYKMVDSEHQWKEIQRKQQENGFIKAQSAVVRDLSSNNNINNNNNRRSGYLNSGMETESEANYLNKRKHRRHHRSHSRSPERSRHISGDIKKHIDYTLIDPVNMTEEEKKDIKYTKIETESRLFKIRYSPQSSQRKMIRGQHLINGKLHGEDTPPPPYTTAALNEANLQETVPNSRINNTNKMHYPIVNGNATYEEKRFEIFYI